MPSRTFYQSHECEGFHARVTIEWGIPPRCDEVFIADRLAVAEDIADSILGFAGKKMRDMVQTMRGYGLNQQKCTCGQAGHGNGHELGCPLSSYSGPIKSERQEKIVDQQSTGGEGS